jgi:SAM-dependent methyltransferase
MTLATGGKMLNFGYWADGFGNHLWIDTFSSLTESKSSNVDKNNNSSNNKKSKTPLEAQQMLCAIVGELAELGSAKTIVDAGSGLGAPAAFWKSCHKSIDMIICLNINFLQLQYSRENVSAALVNATSTTLPLASGSVDRIIALESAQHFRPFIQFVQESARILKRGGILVIAIPVLKTQKKLLLHFVKLGILSVTWSSEHYDLKHVEHAIKSTGLLVESIHYIGSSVYGPLADYYLQNREMLKQRILAAYPEYLEKILYRSILKMKEVSDKGDIEYVLLKARKMK